MKFLGRKYKVHFSCSQKRKKVQFCIEKLEVCIEVQFCIAKLEGKPSTMTVCIG